MNFLARIGRVFIGFCVGTGRLTLFTLNAVSHCFRPPIYLRLIGRQFVDIGYYSLPVVGLTAIFIGMVLALQTPHRLLAPHRRRKRHRAGGGARHDPRAGAGDRGLDGGRPHRRLDRRRDRHHARHRPDRRALDAVDQPLQIPGGAAPPRRHRGAAAAWCWSPTSSACSAASWSATYKLGFNPSAYLQNTADFLHTRRRGVRPDQGAVFGFIDRADGLLLRLSFARRRAGRGRGHDLCGGLGLDPDPDVRLHPDRPCCSRR